MEIIKPCGIRAGKATKQLIELKEKATSSGYVTFYVGKESFKIYVAENDTLEDIKAKIEKNKDKIDIGVEY